MSDDPNAPRERALSPYQLVDACLEVPIDAIEATLALLRSAGARESGLFWYGPRTGANGVVRSVRAPRQVMHPFNYTVDTAALSQMAAALPDDFRTLAQIHSHPGPWVEHSRYDDAMVGSRRALSLVFPDYGRLSRSWPQGVGVHEFQNGYWHLLTDEQAAARVRLTARANIERLDFR
jgi:hypothetical protein